MKKIIYLVLVFAPQLVTGQIDPLLLRKAPKDTTAAGLNMEALYQRPFMQLGKLPVAIGGYAEMNYQYLQEDGITEGHQFQMRRVSVFISSAISNRIKFLSEIEFEDGAKEIGIEFASLDLEFSPQLNLRAGIVLNPIGSFNQNHDGPKWEFVDRPVSATQMLPATWSNAGFGFYGKFSKNNWNWGYEAYLTNGFNQRIIANAENKTFLPASKEDPERFEESFNGSMLLTLKTAIRHREIGELGISYMGGAYNKFKDDGLELDKKRRVNVFALDFNTTIPSSHTHINSEWAWVSVDIPDTYSQQFGGRQSGGFLDIVQPVYRKPILGFAKSVINAAMRVEYVDWNKERFKSTGEKIADDLFCIVPALSWRPTAQTVFRLNYRYHWQHDILGNPASHLAGFQFGFSTYF